MEIIVDLLFTTRNGNKMLHEIRDSLPPPLLFAKDVMVNAYLVRRLHMCMSVYGVSFPAPNSRTYKSVMIAEALYPEDTHNNERQACL